MVIPYIKQYLIEFSSDLEIIEPMMKYLNMKKLLKGFCIDCRANSIKKLEPAGRSQNSIKSWGM